jgi:hypothetical protein
MSTRPGDSRTRNLNTVRVLLGLARLIRVVEPTGIRVSLAALPRPAPPAQAGPTSPGRPHQRPSVRLGSLAAHLRVRVKTAVTRIVAIQVWAGARALPSQARGHAAAAGGGLGTARSRQLDSRQTASSQPASMSESSRKSMYWWHRVSPEVMLEDASVLCVTASPRHAISMGMVSMEA